MSLPITSLIISYLALLQASSASWEPATSTPGFQVLLGPWSSCSRINSSQECFRTRETVCVRTRDNLTAPWYYCVSEPDQRPETVQPCPGECEQACAVSLWSEWSSCDCNTDLYMYRTRTVLSPPRNGGRACPALSERFLCPCAHHLPFDALPRLYSWRTGEWGQCVAQDSQSQCGAGLRTRAVECVDNEGGVVAPSNCLTELAYANLHPPSPQMLCEIPCPCVPGDWSPYTPCTPLCNGQPLSGVQTRTRPILRQATLGLTCDLSTEQTRACTLLEDTCPDYVWETSDWSTCQFAGDATCGNGHTIRYAYCTEVRNGSSKVVDNSMCRRLLDPSDEPLTLRACQVSCTQACLVGEWSPWSECPNSSQPTYNNRTRAVLVPPQGMEVCPHTVEFRLCPALPPARWRVGEFGDCFIFGSSCGEGSQSRAIDCVDPQDNVIFGSKCISLPPPPGAVQTCHVPCPNDCVLSDWSEWSPCSETCDGHEGNRTRTRYFVARGLTCLYSDADLTETETCSDPRPCVLPRYHISAQPWGACVTEETTSFRSSGLPPNHDLLVDEFSHSSCAESGVRNRTSVCVRDEEEVVPDEECPIEFEPLVEESCELACETECAYGEWEEFSECPSPSCGSPGVRRRVRRLLQFSSAGLDECDVDKYGLQVEEEPCPSVQPCDQEVGVAWHDNGWSTCRLYSRVSSEDVEQSLVPATCGLGFENRTVSCVETGTNAMVPDEQCLSVIGPRPPITRACHKPCADRCVVTEWSVFNTCEFGGNISRGRSIVPRTGCVDWRECCEELSTITLAETLPCPSFPAQNYNYFFTNRQYTDCILESPEATCGNGAQFRSAMCLDYVASSATNYQTLVVVDDSFCMLAERMLSNPLVQPCNIRCEKDCVQSDWSDWSACNVTCGSGYRSRTRRVLSPGEEDGRPCGPDVELDVCDSATACPYTKLVPGAFGECVADNTTSQCGPGQRSREALCMVDAEPQDTSVCEDMGVTASFPLTESCVAGCPGECIVGEWSEWEIITPEGSPLCQRRRLREVLRDGEDGCSEMTQEIESLQACETSEVLYTWTSAPWQDCVLGTLMTSDPGEEGEEEEVRTPEYYCGNGIQSRIVTCVKSPSGVPVPDRFCLESNLPRPATGRNCSRPCPIDCRVSAFSDWTKCEGCVANPAPQRRRRHVLIMPNAEGAPCPELEQERPCSPTNCTTVISESHAHLVAPDYTTTSQCGSVLQLEPVSCNVNTQFKSPLECAALGEGVDESYLPLACPVELNCTFGEWSDWSACASLCHTPGTLFSFRTRPLLSSLPHLMEACSQQQYEQSECPPPLPTDHTPSTEPPNEGGTNLMPGMDLEPTTEPARLVSECVDFTWQVSEWNQTGPRDVYCQASTGIRVWNAACPQSIMPRSQNETCEGACPDYANCDVREGVCVRSCEPTFEKVQGVCLPLGGCFEDSHCLISHMQCSFSATCECAEGYVPSSLYPNECVPATSPTTPSPTTTTPVMVTMTTDPASTSSTDAATDDDIITETDDETNVTTDTSNQPTTPGAPPTTSGTSVGFTESPAAPLGIIPVVVIAVVPLILIILVVIILIIIMYKCGRRLDRKSAETEMKRRRIKASISSPSPLPQTVEEMMSRNGMVADASRPNGFTVGFKDDVEEYGLAGDTFLGPHDDHIDEPCIDQPLPSTPQPIPTAPPVPPGRSLSLKDPPGHRNYAHRGAEPSTGRSHSLRRGEEHFHAPVHRQMSLPGTDPRHMAYLKDFPDGGMTTDMTYTTDEDTIGTTSIAPSSAGGSPNSSRRALPPHMYPQEPGYRSNGGHAHYPDGSDPYVAMQRMSPVYAKVNKLRAGSLSPQHASGHNSQEGGRYPVIHPGERDNRLAVGLDNSILRAGTQLDSSSCHTPTSMRSAHSQSSQRRRHSRRRRHQMRSPRYYNDGRYDNYYRGDRRYYDDGYYRSDGQYSSDHDHYSTSDAEYPNDPRSPIRHGPYESSTLPRPSRGVHFSPDHLPSHRRDYEYQTRDYYPGDGEYRRQRHHSQDSPSHSHHKDNWYQYDQQVQDAAMHGYPPPPPHIPGARRPRYHHQDSSYHHKAHPPRHASPQHQTPPPSPRDPPNFVPPVPPHAPSPGFDSDYDYPSRYMPTQLQKLKEEVQSEHNNPYARPRPHNSTSASGSKEQVNSRVTSPYDYPKIRSAGSGASHTPPTTPLSNSDPSSSLVHMHVTSSSPQISRSGLAHEPLQARHSTPQSVTYRQTSTPAANKAVMYGQTTTPAANEASLPNGAAQFGPNTSTPQPNTVVPPQPNVSTPQLGPGTPQLQPNTSTPQPNSAPPQPSTSTPRMTKPSNLTVQISPVSELGDTLSPPGSPYHSRRAHPPSPLVLHSNSMSDDSPRTSGEISEMGVGPNSSAPQQIVVQQ